MADNIKGAKVNDVEVWKMATDNLLYPRPMNLRNLEQAKVKHVCEVFRLAGTFVAKSIIDDRRIELPISPIMWDVLLDRRPTMVDLKKYDETEYRWILELQKLANQKRDIEESNKTAEEKEKLKGEILTSHGTTLEKLYSSFVL